MALASERLWFSNEKYISQKQKKIFFTIDNKEGKEDKDEENNNTKEEEEEEEEGNNKKGRGICARRRNVKPVLRALQWFHMVSEENFCGLC